MTGPASGSDGPGQNRRFDDVVERLFRSGLTNAVLAWIEVVVLALVFVESAAGADYRWVVFVAAVGLIVLVPPISSREWRVMLPWELLVVALFPILVRGLVGGSVGTFATYLAIAGLALIVTVELHTFTSLRVTHWFAIGLVVMTTLAVVAAWTVFRWNADRYLGTSYLVDNEALMIEWLSVALAGLAAGVLFDGYFARRDRVLWRLLRRMVGR